jgi:RNA polymerase sigma factor (sigma-70 family)
MPAERVHLVVQHIRRWLGAPADMQIADVRLLADFVQNRNEAAFTAIVRRHGPLVLDVCRRVLADAHRAEDAFQATFLVLVRKAGSLRQPELLANWLYGVAYRTALKARANDARRQALEHEGAAMRPTPSEEAGWQELRPVIDEEVQQLPAKYRLPVVLCYLSGQSHEEAARQLAWPVGTVKGRLARARDLLRKRLTRRGLALAAAFVASLPAPAAAAISGPLIATTVDGALLFATGAAGAAAPGPAALAEGVLRNMFLSRMRTVVAVVIVVAMLGIGTTVAMHVADKSPRPTESVSTPVPLDTEASPAKTDVPANTMIVPGALADQDGRVGFVRQKDKGLQALELATGNVLWKCAEADHPLVLDGARLLAARIGADRKIQVAILDVGRAGKFIRRYEDVATLPPNSPSPPAIRFEAARLVKDDLLAWWQGFETMPTVTGGAPKPEGGPGPTYHGFFRLDLDSGRGEVGPMKPLNLPLPVEPGPEAKLSPALTKAVAGRHWDLRPVVVGDYLAGVCQEDDNKARSHFVLRRWNLATGAEEKPMDLRQASFKESAVPSSDRRQVGLFKGGALKPSLTVFSLETGKQLLNLELPNTGAVAGFMLTGTRLYVEVEGERELVAKTGDDLVGTRTYYHPHVLKTVEIATRKTAWQTPLPGRTHFFDLNPLAP